MSKLLKNYACNTCVSFLNTLKNYKIPAISAGSAKSHHLLKWKLSNSLTDKRKTSTTKPGRNLYVSYHPIKVQTNCFWIIVSIFRPWNSSIIENILVITCKTILFAMKSEYPWDKSQIQVQVNDNTHPKLEMILELLPQENIVRSELQLVEENQSLKDLEQ